MSALKFARQAFAEKPHSSVSDWIDILTKGDYKEESYDGIPELVDAIELQGTSGSAEVSRALRKKLKHGNAHQQYRALVILKALVDNCGDKFRKIFQDGHLTDALKNLACEFDTDRRVKKKLLLVLSAWDEQYKDDPNMHFVAGILRQCGGGLARRVGGVSQGATIAGQNDLGVAEPPNGEEEKKKKKKKKRDILVDLSKSERTREKEDQKKQHNKRVPFNFEKEKEKVLQSVVEGSQASSNLVNAITLVNTKTDSVQKNERVQECLEQAKKAKTQIVRYIRLVENEEIIGTLIETNDRVMSAIEMYDQLTVSGVDDQLAKALAATHLAHSANNNGLFSSPFDNGSDENDSAQHIVSSTSAPHIHPDLEDLTFGPVRSGQGSSTSKLPAPLKPSFQVLSDDDDHEDRLEQRASLSDFSDYETSDEETPNKGGAGPSRRNYVTVSDDDSEGFMRVPLAKNNVVDDPFADPFADEQAPRRR